MKTLHLVKQWFALPETANFDLDDPLLTARRRDIVLSKPFLRQIYEEWYATLKKVLPSSGPLLEIGSGGGFLAEVVPDVITSDILHLSNVHIILDGTRLPFRDTSLGGILMVNTLHHIPSPQAFFSEATRCIRPGGSIAMIEPWNTPWSRLVYTYLHHEPFQPNVEKWALPGNRALSDANGALPWILFHRDRARFETLFPEWEIQLIRPMMPFRYLLSGGMSMRALAPACSYALWRRLESHMERWMKHLGMFAFITLQRRRIS